MNKVIPLFLFSLAHSALTQKQIKVFSAKFPKALADSFAHVTFVPKGSVASNPSTSKPVEKEVEHHISINRPAPGPGQGKPQVPKPIDPKPATADPKTPKEKLDSNKSGSNRLLQAATNSDIPAVKPSTTTDGSTNDAPSLIAPAPVVAESWFSLSQFKESDVKVKITAKATQITIDNATLDVHVFDKSLNAVNDSTKQVSFSFKVMTKNKLELNPKIFDPFSLKIKVRKTQKYSSSKTNQAMIDQKILKQVERKAKMVARSVFEELMKEIIPVTAANTPKA